MWTRFTDMMTGGTLKAGWKTILLDMMPHEAIQVLERSFNVSINSQSCPCCGRDWQMDFFVTLEEATASLRNCKNNGKEYVEEPNDGHYSTSASFYRSVEDFAAKAANFGVLIVHSTDVFRGAISIVDETEFEGRDGD